MKEKIDKAKKVLQEQLFQILNESGNTIDNQRLAIRTIFIITEKISRERNAPFLKYAAIDFIKTNYPQFKEDLDKLLILS